jgi:hypothetical protein
MTPNRDIKSLHQAVKERNDAMRRETEATARAERAEMAERNLTRELDRAHREVDRLRALVASSGERVT